MFSSAQEVDMAESHEFLLLEVSSSLCAVWGEVLIINF